jgi:hypothetical protein
MRLRRNEYCPVHKSISCCGREHVPKPRTIRLGVQRIDDPHHPRGYRELRSASEIGSFSTSRLWSRIGSARSATKNSPTTTTSSPTTGIQKEWEERGETTIQTIFKQHTGGATEKKDQPEKMTDGRRGTTFTPTIPSPRRFWAASTRPLDREYRVLWA